MLKTKGLVMAVTFDNPGGLYSEEYREIEEHLLRIELLLKQNKKELEDKPSPNEITIISGQIKRVIELSSPKDFEEFYLKFHQCDGVYFCFRKAFSSMLADDREEEVLNLAWAHPATFLNEPRANATHPEAMTHVEVESRICVEIFDLYLSTELALVNWGIESVMNRLIVNMTDEDRRHLVALLESHQTDRPLR
ncbi:MAG: hypothetical protein S4CHLAM102_08340 [Chlamydiia bacterium]|nr:hypothetical protein [Chlamydiia bacterium]